MQKIRRNSSLRKKIALFILVGLLKKCLKSKLQDHCRLALLNHSIVQSLTPESASSSRIRKQILDSKLKNLIFHVLLKLLASIDSSVISISLRTSVNFKEIMTYFWPILEFIKCYQNCSVKISTPRRRSHAQSKSMALVQAKN